jgi:FKBP-type peptidyl-prolyl cis-trans isomerase FkpA
MRKLTLSLLTILAASAAIAAPAVEKLPSGVTVQKTRLARGEQPKATDTVKVHYRGTLQKDGKEVEFDSSYARHAPATFSLNQVIPCWTEGVQKLNVGEKAVLVCPPQTAYGQRGVPGKIDPNTTLTFEVELLGIEK